MTRRTRPHSRPPTPSDDACDPLSASSCLSYWAWSSRLCFLQLPHHNQLSICSKTIQAVVVSRRKSTASWRIGWNKLVKHRRRHPGRGGLKKVTKVESSHWSNGRSRQRALVTSVDLAFRHQDGSLRSLLAWLPG